MTLFEALINKDERPKKGAWAPGNYRNTCWTCMCGFTGDKRARQCAACAYKEEDGAKARE